VLLGLAGTAHAVEGAVTTSLISPSRHELLPTVGYQFGFGGAVGSPSGVKLAVDYAFRFHRLAWFDLQISNVFGFGPADGTCSADPLQRCYRGGWDFGVAAGVRWKLHPSPSVIVEVPLMAGVQVVYARDCGDTGAAVPVARPGVKAMYYVAPKLGLGGGIDVALGPAFHSAGSTICKSGGSYTSLYGAFSFSLGAEFLL
jgi:hypothetical protein